MRRLRTQRAPYISILSIGVDENTNDRVLKMSCGILTPEIQKRVKKIECIRLTSLTNEFKIDAWCEADNHLGSLVRQDLEFAAPIVNMLRSKSKDSSICLRLFSILKPHEFVLANIRAEIIEKEHRRAA